MSKPVFEDLLKFSGRRNRKSYLLVQLLLLVIVTVNIFVCAGLVAYGGVVGTYLAGLGLISFFALALAMWTTSAQRVRDIGYSGVWALIQLVPYIGFVAGLAIFIAPGETAVENKYGPSCI